jgi:hypothetical protein
MASIFDTLERFMASDYAQRLCPGSSRVYDQVSVTGLQREVEVE